MRNWQTRNMTVVNEQIGQGIDSATGSDICVSCTYQAPPQYNIQYSTASATIHYWST